MEVVIRIKSNPDEEFLSGELQNTNLSPDSFLEGVDNSPSFRNTCEMPVLSISLTLSGIVSTETEGYLPYFSVKGE